VALIACQQGRLNDAHRLAATTLDAADPPEGPPELTKVEARQVLAEVCFERNQLGPAQDHLESALRQCWTTGATPYMWAVEADLIQIMIARQQAAGALQRLHSLRRLIDPKLAAGPLRRKLNQADIEARLALGDLDGALELARTTPTTELPCAAAARLDLCAGRPDRALSRLDLSSVAGLAGEIRELVLRACANRLEGRWQGAEHTMRRAVELARTDHYVRPFLETPSLTASLLRGLSDSDRDPYLSQLVGQADQLTVPASLPSSSAMLEPLTERERQVLQQLSSHHTLRQIGVAMFVSTNTIKTHVKAIYRKTGAACRDDAVTIARSHGLL
jgi:LuxR family maltose regulon positive regulatory protein